MSPLKKILGSGIIVIGLCIAGFVMLLRGCLSKYDERSALPSAIYFEKGNKPVIFSIVKFEKATSYSRNGGFVRKSVSTDYYVQSNDGITLVKLLDKKVKEHGDVKNHPVELLGSSSGYAWVYLGELMAFDPYTLETIADKRILEQKNPSLKNKLPGERKYYEFDDATGSIILTSTDGYKWKLDTKTMHVSTVEKDHANTNPENEIKRLTAVQKKLTDDFDVVYQQALKNAKRGEYTLIMQKISPIRTNVYRQRDSLQDLITKLRVDERNEASIKHSLAFLKRSSPAFSQIKINQDTLGDTWFGLYSADELEKLNDRIYLTAVYGESERRNFYSGSYVSVRSGGYEIEKNKLSTLPAGSFLNGGFLLNKKTAKPIKLNSPSSHLVVSKTVIGNEGKIILSRVNGEGKAVWTFDSGLKEWNDWILTAQRLYIFGTTNKELSTGESNMLYVIDLLNGNAKSYDFFTDKN